MESIIDKFFSRHRKQSRWPLILLAVLGISFTSAAWADSSPVGSSPDEGAHVLYSWGVITGQVVPWSASEWSDDQGVQWVGLDYPSSFDDRPAEACYMFSSHSVPCAVTAGEKAASDAGTAPSTSQTTHGSTYMSRYPPLYYVFTGAAEWTGLALGLNGVQAILVTRFASGLLCLSMLAWSVSLLVRRFGAAAALVAASFAVTPQFLSLASSVNPNGFEIAAAFALAAAVVLVRAEFEAGSQLSGETRVLFLTASLALAFARPASIVWACLLWLLLFLPLRRTRRPALLSLKPPTVVATILVAAGALAWFVYENLSRKGGTVGQSDSTWSALSPAVRLLVIVLHFGTMIDDGFTLLGWGDTRLPTLAFVIWISLGAFIIGQFLVRSRTHVLRPRWAVIFVALSAAAIIVQSYAAAFAWQGRYLLPVLAAALVLLVPAMSESAPSRRMEWRLAVAAVISAVLVELVCIAVNLFRYAFGYSTMPSRFDDLPIPTQIGTWHPAGGLDAVALAAVVGAVALSISGWLLLRSDHSPDGIATCDDQRAVLDCAQSSALVGIAGDSEAARIRESVPGDSDSGEHTSD